MDKVYAAVRAIGTLLAVVAAFVPIPNIDVNAALVILGIIAGISVAADATQRMIIAAIALPVIGVALGNVPAIGEQLGAVASNWGLLAAGNAATIIAMAVFNRLKGDWT